MNKHELTKAVSLARKPIDDVLSEVGKLWAKIGLDKDEAADRLLCIEEYFVKTAETVREREERFAKQEEIRLATARDEALAIAAEVGDKLKYSISDKDTIRKQIEVIQSEHSKLETKFFDQSTEVTNICKEISSEADRMGVDKKDFTISTELTGLAALEAIRRKKDELGAVHKRRVEDARRKQSKILSLQEDFGRRLFFRLAERGEVATVIEDVVVLECCDKNEQFVTDCATCESQDNASVMSSANFMEFLNRLEKEYLAALARSKRTDKNCRGSRKGNHSSQEKLIAIKDEHVVSCTPSDASESPSPARSSIAEQGRSSEMDKSPNLKHRFEALKRRTRFRHTGEKVRRRRRLPSSAIENVPQFSSRSRSRSRHVGVSRARRTRPRDRSKTPERPPWAPRRKLSRSPPRLTDRNDASLERCHETLDRMQGRWVDKKGISYVVEDRFVRRDDGRKFPLFVKHDAIQWGAMSKYYARPDKDSDIEVRWFNARNGNVAWIWERPRDR